MLTQLLVRTALLTLVLAAPVSASGAEYGTAAEAKAMLNRAILEVKADKAGAIAKFNHNDPLFRDRDLFVFCFNVKDGKFTAHEAMTGLDARKLKDSTGRSFVEEMYQNAREDEIAEVSFVSPLPGSTKLVAKRAFVARIGDQVCGVSVYQSNK